MKYVIQNGYVGNAMLFWKKEGAGYTTNLDDSELFEKEAAEKIQTNCKSSHNFEVWPIDYLRTKIEPCVESQRCSHEEAKIFEFNNAK